MPNPLHIRLMTNDDLPVLSQIYVRALDDTDERWNQESAQALLSDWLRRQPELAFTAEYDNEIAGAFVVAVRPWWDGNHLVDGELFVEPKLQQHGIARHLLKRVLDEAMEKYSPVLWESYTFRNDTFPLTWYKRLGFREIEEWVMIRADIASVAKQLSLLPG
jgi:GNAT superfamily N-acetyltransferase